MGREACADDQRTAEARSVRKRECAPATAPARPTAHVHEVLHAVREYCHRRSGLEPPELERLADLLLRVFAADPEYPIRADLERGPVELHSLDDRRDPLARAAHRQPAPPETTTATQQALIARLLVDADLHSVGQREVARLRLWGYALPEIATLLGLPLATVRGRWRRARERLQVALAELSAEEPVEGVTARGAITSAEIGATFRAAQDPPRYEPPRHCPEGRERCAHTGVCCRRPGADPWR